MQNETKDDPTRVIVGPLVLSYPALFTPRAGDEAGQEPRYSAEFWVYADNQRAGEINGKLVSAMTAACAEKGVPYNAHSMPALKPVDPAKTDGKQVWFFRANSNMAPELYVKRANGGSLEPANPSDNMYAGCIVYVALKAAYYNFQPQAGGVAKGVKFYLNSVCQTGDGPRLATKPDFSAAFNAPHVTVSEFTTPPSAATAFASHPGMAPAPPAPQWQQAAPTPPAPPWQQATPAPPAPQWQQAAPAPPAPQWQQATPAPPAPPAPQWQQAAPAPPAPPWQQAASGPPPGITPQSWALQPPAVPGWGPEPF